jgi:nucleoside-diphosphate-sugar epimerase
MMSTICQNQLGVLGATSFVGTCLLQQLTNDQRSVVAFSRRDIQKNTSNVEWRQLNSTLEASPHKMASWVCLAPIMALPEHFKLLESSDAKKIVVLSSTSRYTKNNSSDPHDQLLALQLAEAEERVQAWAQSRGIEWVILRPTLIYGLGRDKNISEIARFVRRFGLFSLFNKASGLRQPIHVQDVANACLLALQTSTSTNRAYNISGAETITYREMVLRIFSAMDKRPRLFSIPLWMFSVAVYIVRCVPRYRNWSTAMAERMNRDMVFDHSEAERDFGFKPRGFQLTAEDLPI